MLQKAPRYSGMRNPLMGGQSPQHTHGVATQHPIGGIKKGNPIGEFQIGRRSESKKVKEIFG